MITWNYIFNTFLAYVILLEISSAGYGSKKNLKDHTSSNQMESVHSVRHMARLMRRVLAEETDADVNVTNSPLSSEASTVNTFVLTSTKSSSSSVAPSPSTAVETSSQMHRDVKTNQSSGGRGSFDNSAFGSQCPGFLPCSALNVECIVCDLNESCVYGEDVMVHCHAKANINCQGVKDFKRLMNCRYCYQTPESQHECNQNVTCRVISSPRQRFITSCTVLPHILCLGSREFYKNMLCNWSKGYSWTTALTLSIVLGGFGVDRFYLGMWQEGIGKLFSFGGLGVWTLVDVILIATGYLGPADGSLYIP